MNRLEIILYYRFKIQAIYVKQIKSIFTVYAYDIYIKTAYKACIFTVNEQIW